MLSHFYYSLKCFPKSLVERKISKPLGRWSVFTSNYHKELKCYMANYDNEQSTYLYCRKEANKIVNKNMEIEPETNKENNKTILEQFYLIFF